MTLALQVVKKTRTGEMLPVVGVVLFVCVVAVCFWNRKPKGMAPGWSLFPFFLFLLSIILFFFVLLFFVLCFTSPSSQNECITPLKDYEIETNIC